MGAACGHWGGQRLFPWHCQAELGWNGEAGAVPPPCPETCRSQQRGKGAAALGVFLQPLLPTAPICRADLRLELSRGLGHPQHCFPQRGGGSRELGRTERSPSAHRPPVPSLQPSHPAALHCSSSLPSACVPQPPQPPAQPLSPVPRSQPQRGGLPALPAGWVPALPAMPPAKPCEGWQGAWGAALQPWHPALPAPALLSAGRCQARGTLGTWRATPRCPAGLGGAGSPEESLLECPGCREGQMPGEERGSRGLSSVWQAGKGPRGGGRAGGVCLIAGDKLCSCAGRTGPAAPPPQPCPTRLPRAAPGLGREGSLAGTGLAQGRQLGSISRVIKSRNASPSSRTGQAEPASLAGDGSHRGELAQRAPSTPAPSPRYGGCFGTGA